MVTDVRYGKGLARFRNQLGIAASADNSGPFTAGGDSGSAIVDRDQTLVGLLFAGSETRTLANPAQTVLDEIRAALKVKGLDVAI